jgi:hypothetical protein
LKISVATNTCLDCVMRLSASDPKGYVAYLCDRCAADERIRERLLAGGWTLRGGE